MKFFFSTPGYYYSTRLCLPGILLLITLVLHSQVKTASVFTDNMVLQQTSSVPLWGWASPGKTIS
ncbi:MAG TPA: hypothetical protein VGE06_03765, partial [Flavisolibacter sp.]